MPHIHQGLVRNQHIPTAAVSGLDNKTIWQWRQIDVVRIIRDQVQVT
jgi:hypothetical protein